MSKHLYFLLLPLIFIISACTNKNQHTDQTSGEIVKTDSMSVHRYERALFSLNPESLRKQLPKIYPEFAFFLGNSWQDTMNLMRLYNYITDPNIRELNDYAQQQFPDDAYFRNSLEPVFKRIQQYYPERPIPDIYTFVSGLDISVPAIYADTVLAISLDLFLGKNVPAYAKAGIPAYMSHRFNKEHLVPACVNAFCDSIVNSDPDKQTLIDLMVEAGKRLYFMDMMLPELKDHVLIGYPAEKLTWCEQNEANIWSFLITNQFLFSGEPVVISKMMTDAPFTAGFVNTSPGRLGEWVGWQIVKAYMKNSRKSSVQDLMKDTDAQSILRNSGYKPAK